MQYYLLFTAYLVLFAWLVTKVKFFTRTGFSNSQLIILFLLKVMAGIFYGWIGVYYGQMAQMVDTWAYHMQALDEHKLLLSHPIRFFTSLFDNSYSEGYTNFLVSKDSWWNDVKANFFIKTMAVFDVFSFGNYYVNVIFYSFLSMFGPVAFYRVMKHAFPGAKTAVFITTFLLPSFLYWTSGLHKEGLIFLGLALVIFHIYFGLQTGRFSVGSILTIFFGFALVLILRNFLILPLVPCLLAWITSEKLKAKPVVVFATVSIISIGLFFGAKYIVPGMDLPESVVLKQQEFIKLEGNSSVSVKQLEPTFRSFIINAPQALTLAGVRPYPSDVHHLLSLAAAVEIILIICFVTIFLLCRKPAGKPSSFVFFSVMFSFGVLFMIGYSVNNLGAIVRYRSFILPLLLAPMAAYTDWARIGRFITSLIKNNLNTYKIG